MKAPASPEPAGKVLNAGFRKEKKKLHAGRFCTKADIQIGIVVTIPFQIAGYVIYLD